MTRREVKQWQAKLHEGATLPQICLGLRIALNGSADPWPDSLVIETAAMLWQTVLTWEQGGHVDAEMDVAVLSLVIATCRYAEDEVSRICGESSELRRRAVARCKPVARTTERSGNPGELE